MTGRAKLDHADEGDIAFNLNTTIAVELGSYAILAAAPTSTADGSAIALVVRVTEE